MTTQQGALLELADVAERAEVDQTYAVLLNAWRETEGGLNPPLDAKDHPNLRYRRFAQLLEVGAFLDAAMMLVPDGHDWGGGSKDCTGTAWAWCGNRKQPGSIFWETMTPTNAASPALALAAACLRVRALAQSPQGDEG